MVPESEPSALVLTLCLYIDLTINLLFPSIKSFILHQSKPHDLIVFTKPHDSMLLRKIMTDLILWATSINKLKRVDVTIMDSHWHRPTLKMAFLIMWNERFLDFYMLHLCELNDTRSIDETIHILQYAYT